MRENLIRVKRRSKKIVYDKFYGGGAAIGNGELVATIAKNCDFENGALRCGFGLLKYRPNGDSTINVANSPTVYGKSKQVFTALITSKTDGKLIRTIGMQTNVNRIFMYNFDEKSVQHVLLPNELNRALSYVYPDGLAKVIFCCKDQVFLYDFVNKVTKIYIGECTSACLFHERLFVSTPNSIKYTVPMEISNFTPDFNGGGEVKFQDARGRIVWLEAFGEKIYVFFEYGIAMLSADGEGCNFRIVNIPYGGERIIPRTICTYEHRLVFAGLDGVYFLEGQKCSRVKDFNYKPLKTNAFRASAACIENRFFLFYIDEKGSERSLAVDLTDVRNTSDYFIMYGLNQSGGEAMCSPDYAYMRLDKDGDLLSGEYLFEVRACNFGSIEEKSFKYLTLEGQGKCEVTIIGRSGKRVVEYDLGVRDKDSSNTTIQAQRSSVGLKGREFSIKIVMQKGCVIRKMSVEYDELGGVK